MVAPQADPLSFDLPEGVNHADATAAVHPNGRLFYRIHITRRNNPLSNTNILLSG